MFHMMRYHYKQLFSSKRWVFVVAIDAFLALGIILERMISNSDYTMRYHVAPPTANIWDVPVDLLCGNFITIFILVIAFVFLVGDAFLRDERTGRFPMLFARTNNRATWFVSLIPVIFVAAVAFVTAAFAISLGIALLVLPAGTSFSPFLTGNAAHANIRPYSFPTMPPSPPLFFLGVIGYLAPALCFLALLSVVISVWWRQTAAVFIPVAWIFLDMTLNGWVTRYLSTADRFFFSTQLQLTKHWEWADFPTMLALYPFPVAASVIAFCTLVVVWSVVGFISFRQADL
ncbi:MAG: hypothetical protein ABFD13_03640 [Candidatus Cryosericum sp.]|nr:hypothetical protein [bacterium]